MANINTSDIDDTPKYTKRPYQRAAINTLVRHTGGLVRGSLDLETEQNFPSAILMEMATGSGKTYTTGEILEKIIETRNRLNCRYNTGAFEGLNVLVLTNRIDGVNQFRDDLFHGKSGEKSRDPILSESLRNNSRIRTFHSRGDNLDDIDPRFFTRDESDEVENLAGESTQTPDTFYFATFQTAILKDLATKLPYIDIIIIDEAHNVTPGSDYDMLLGELVLQGRGNITPMMVALTATPTNLTKELFGEPGYRFGLAEYLASGYAPGVSYHLVTATTAPEDAIKSLQNQVEFAKNCPDSLTKRQLVGDIKREFEAIMASYPDMGGLVSDLIDQRIGGDPETVGQTIIFVNHTTEADAVAETINQQYGREVATAYHSYNDQRKTVSWSDQGKTGLDRLAHSGDPIRIIVCVDKLNESVDIPTVENIVFWRGTDIERIFLQQFGRGLRGDGTVNYYDYVGGLRNFAWIGAIHEEYRELIERGGEGGGRPPSEFALLGGDILGEHRHIDLSDIGFQITILSDETENLLGTTPEEIIATLAKHEVRNGDDLKEKGTVWFQATFGNIDFGKFLRKTTHYISLSDLQELATKIGWEMEIEKREKKISLGTTKEEIIATLAKYEITNGGELNKRGSKWFAKTFGIKDSGKFLGRTGHKISVSDLQDLITKIGWEIEVGVEKMRLGTTTVEIITALVKQGITNGKELKNKGTNWLQTTFGVRDIGKYLGRNIYTILLSDLQELATKIGWEMEIEKREAKISLGTTKVEIITALVKQGITNGDELKKKGARKLQETFGVRDIGKYLGKTIYAISMLDLHDLATKIGWEMEFEVREEKILLGTTLEEIIVTLVKYEITDGDKLKEKGCKWFQRTFGRNNLGKFLGRTIQKISVSDIQELAERLWGDNQ